MFIGNWTFYLKYGQTESYYAVFVQYKQYSLNTKICHIHYPWIINIVTIVPILAGTCDLESLVASGHK